METTYVFRSFNDIEAIEIVGVGLINGTQRITVEKLRTTSVYDSTPIVVTTLTGMDLGQVISIQGVLNVEAVPGAELRVDLKPEESYTDGSDIHAARNLRTLLRHHNGYDFLSTIRKYEQILDLV